LYLDGGKIQESGKPLDKNELIEIAEHKEGKVVLKLKSGKYSFSLE
jgi:hypothetical protein